MKGWQQEYVDGIAALGADFAAVDPAEQDARLAARPPSGDLLYAHACEGAYGAPEYGGNRDWRAGAPSSSRATCSPAATPTPR